MFEKRKLIKLAQKNGWTIKEIQHWNHLQVEVYDNTSVTPIYSRSDKSMYFLGRDYNSPYAKIIREIEKAKYPQQYVVYTPDKETLPTGPKKEKQ